MGATAWLKTQSVSGALSEVANTITHVAIGDDNTAPTDTDTALGNQTYIEEVFDTDLRSLSVEFQLYLDTAENNGNDIEEIGLFDAISGGALYAHALTVLLSKTSSLEVFIGYKITMVAT